MIRTLLASLLCCTALTVAAADFVPEDADVARIEKLTRDYYEAIDAMDYAASWALLTPEVRAELGEKAWEAAQREARAENGALRERVLRRTTWYLDPEDAPRKGLYVAVDFDSVHDEGRHLSEYLVWYRAPGAKDFALLRHESTLMKNVGHGQQPQPQAPPSTTPTPSQG